MFKTNVKIPFQIIFFGASGDLASLKLFPAVYDLFLQRRFPADFQIIGYGRSKLSDEQFRKLFSDSIEKANGKNPPKLSELLEHLFYFSGNYDQVEDFEKLEKFCQKIKTSKQKHDQVAYFSVPPQVFKDLIVNLSKTFKKTNKALKLVVEKPFGTNEKTAHDLVNTLHKYFDKKQFFLLDHYLGKRTVQSILKLRMENNIINQLLKGGLIENIQLTAFEQSDVGQRVGYFDQAGIIRDMLQSHLMQILALITMDIPTSPSRESLQREKAALLAAVRFSGKSADVIVGQFDGYKKLEGVAKNSQTETFAAVKLSIDKREWFNIPIIFRAGKKLKDTKTKAVIEFKKMPFQKKDCAANKLVFELKPEEKLEIVLFEDARKGSSMTDLTSSIQLKKSLACVGDDCLSDYGNLILDVLVDKKDFFLSAEEIISSWKVTDKILAAKKKNKLLVYKSGSNGPKEQNDLALKNKLEWYEL